MICLRALRTLAEAISDICTNKLLMNKLKKETDVSFMKRSDASALIVDENYFTRVFVAFTRTCSNNREFLEQD